MAEFLVPYYPAVAAYVVLGVLFLVQLLVADVAGIGAGHVPGMPVATGHDDFFFRATRAIANTNESVAGFLVLSLAAILLGANATWTNRLVVVFVASRLAHMLAYYADLRIARSASFGVAVICLVGLAVCAATALG